MSETPARRTTRRSSRTRSHDSSALPSPEACGARDAAQAISVSIRRSAASADSSSVSASAPGSSGEMGTAAAGTESTDDILAVGAKLVAPPPGLFRSPPGLFRSPPDPFRSPPDPFRDAVSAPGVPPPASVVGLRGEIGCRGAEMSIWIWPSSRTCICSA
eukprot:scaffold29266_cov73-Isochrysis_galbana.AAC.1